MASLVRMTSVVRPTILTSKRNVCLPSLPKEDLIKKRTGRCANFRHATSSAIQVVQPCPGGQLARQPLFLASTLAKARFATARSEGSSAKHF